MKSRLTSCCSLPTRWLRVVSPAVAAIALSGQAPSKPLLGGQRTVDVAAVANAITELDVQPAKSMLEGIDTASVPLSYQRARLAVYVGDCDSSEAILTTLPESPESGRLLDLSRKCARATAGSVVVEDKERGVWVRVQDAEDEALVPLLAEVAQRARQTMIDDLGIALPLPIRIDLVRDLFSLASVSGLPLEAAETTGTVAVARWGRVTMLSPRAARLGYPWQDTLAHELTHLALSRGSRDYAPLWLQEGIAKREEVRWRAQRPHDDKRDPHTIARDALLTGRSIGIDRIGPSIAMLPSADDARISYAEVESFMDFWLNKNGRDAFTLLLLDLKGLSSREVDEAMISVTGFPLAYWIWAWQGQLRAMEPAKEEERPDPEDGSGGVIQSVRLGDLLADQGRVALAGEYFDRAVKGAPSTPGVRFRAAATQFSLGHSDAAARQLGTFDDVASLHGGWLGLLGRVQLSRSETALADGSFALAVAIDPFGQEAACEGFGRRTDPPDSPVGDPRLPSDPVRRNLCESARRIVRE